MEKILLVVPVHNRLSEVKELLSSLRTLNLDGLDLSITIVDDASQEPVPKSIELEFSDLNLRLIHCDVNIGPSRARNLALKKSDADIFWFLDSDSEIDNPQVLNNMVEVLRTNHEIGAVGGVVEPVEGEWMVFEPISFLNTLGIPQYLRRRAYPLTFVSVIPTANLLILKNVFELTNSFDERLPRNEDGDLCMALKKLEYKSMQSEKTLVRHKLSRAGRDSGAFAHFQDSKKYFADLLKTRSILLYKHSWWKLVILPILDMLTLIEIILGSKKYNFKLVRFSMVKKENKFVYYFNLALLSAYYYFYGLLLPLKFRSR